jgi:uncharacterized protein YdeI (YjbR/CyaY-like superfamily)
VKSEKCAEVGMPDELINKFEERPDLKTAFAALTSRRQKGKLDFAQK